jgi:hypothetical protein
MSKTPQFIRRTVLKGSAAAAGAALVAKAGLGTTGTTEAAATQMGPSTKTAPYVLPTASNVELTSVITVGESAGNDYRMVGIPDGLGAFANDSETFTLLMNHELVSTVGITRSHGSKGAFVSQWTIDRKTLRVLEGVDHAAGPQEVYVWDVPGKKYSVGPVTLNRHCSGDLPAVSALWYNGKGTTDRIYLNGEEDSSGRGWARIVTGAFAGQLWQLPRLGRIAFENVVANPGSKDLTIVAVTDDGALSPAPISANYPSEVYIYVGHKTVDPNPVVAAGLTNGKLYGVQVQGVSGGVIKEESETNGLGSSSYLAASRFTLVPVGNDGDVSAMSPIQMQQDSIDRDVFRLQRPEDSCWDPRPGRERDLYFVTTASIMLTSRLWRLRFDDISNPEAGGEIRIMLNATKGRMFDNITIDKLGRLMLQEDTGNEPHVSKIWLYGIDTGEFIELAHHDEDLFISGRPKFITQDEESSGIIDASEVLGEGWFLFDVQVHKANPDPELVEMGQLVAMYVHPDMGRRK